MKRLLAFGLCVVLLLGISVPAFAADTAAVDYCAVNIVVDGARLCPKDADGKPVEPFIWNGTTYLPVRSVANALGLEVSWEPGTVKLTSGAERTAAIGQPIESTRSRTISIGGQDTKVTLDGKELDLKDAAGNPVTPIISDGVTYLPVRAVADALEVPVLWDGETATVYLGKAIEWRLVREEQTEETYKTYYYDAQGHLTMEIWYFPFYVITFHYQYEGNRRIGYEREDLDDSSGLNSKMTCTYNEAGQLIGWQVVYENGTVDEFRCTYDENGNQVTNTGSGGVNYEFIRTFDAYNRCIREEQRSHITDDSPGVMYILNYTYDEHTNNLLSMTKLDEDGEPYSVTTYSYDEYGNLIEAAETHCTDYYDTMAYTTTYEYTPIYK